MIQRAVSPDAGIAVQTNDSVKSEAGVLDAHVVILNNYIRRHHVVSYRALARRVRKLSILLSVEMEPDRNWEAEWEGLDVTVQKNWMMTTKWRHSSGFKEDNFIHIPVDTVSQLKRLQPDIVFSYEMGMRTLFSGWFRRFRPNIPLVMVGNMSENIEKERGLMRRMMRNLVCRSVDAFTYNGPSCKRYLTSLGIEEPKLHHVPYCIDPAVVYQGPRELAHQDRPRRFLYCGSISERKGLVAMMEGFQRYLAANSEGQIELQIAGEGPLKTQLQAMATERLHVRFLGNLNPSGLREANANADICVLPTYADEWGLTSIEALASGIPVLGSWYAQSIEAVVEDGRNGWTFLTDDPKSLDQAVQHAMATSCEQLHRMVSICRDSVAHISDHATADSFCRVVKALKPQLDVVPSLIQEQSS